MPPSRSSSSARFVIGAGGAGGGGGAVAAAVVMGSPPRLTPFHHSTKSAAALDPSGAMAWLGLSRAMDEWKGNGKDALKKAQALLDKCNDRERRLITARAQLKGLDAKLEKDEDRRKAAVRTLDELLALYD